jgi:hypothetical protein
MPVEAMQMPVANRSHLVVAVGFGPRWLRRGEGHRSFGEDGKIVELIEVRRIAAPL